ncbi:MAG: hypothetical protein ABFC90_06580 [Bacteroidales bacterium]|nr:hypothetical protein [Bacteroidales bacterium]
MKKDINHKKSKLTYQAPDIKRIRLDNEISLVLSSSPAAPGYDPAWGEVKNSVKDPFKGTIC